jgi:hypothetical protein
MSLLQTDAGFTSYQKLVVALMAFLQFSIILDFMVMSPLGAMLMPALQVTPSQFGLMVSAYAFSAGISAVLAAGFADRFDRKNFLLFFYVGFILGTFLCAMAPTYAFLLFGRIVTGIFGGVIGSVVLAITTDLFPLQMRGRVMGVVQTAFAASQILGLPIWALLRQYVGVACAVHDDRSRLDLRVWHHLRLSQTRRRTSPATDRKEPLPPPVVHVNELSVCFGLCRDGAADARRLHVDAVRQRLHRQQSRHRPRKAAYPVLGHGSKRDGGRPARGPRQ